MSKKRKREVDVELVKVYDELADETESVRIKAALTLVSKVFKPGVTSQEQTKSILTRLFRGLCSSRKAARLGFSVALTELLSELPLSSAVDSDITLSPATVVDILEAQTVPEGGTSGQDERDHFFGRVFGAEAILKSGILFRNPDPSQWNRLLELICTIAHKKPWLRQACGRALFSSLANGDPRIIPQAFAIDTVSVLSANKLIRTPEGVVIWIAASRTFPQAPLPKSVWKFGDPLAEKDINSLATILKDARTQPDGSDQGFEAQGSAGWSANLHFAWDVVLGELYQQTSEERSKSVNGRGRISFQSFWQTVVDGSLFADSSSTERKAWGFSLWRKVFESAPQSFLQHTFSHQALRCLVNSLKAPERYLQKSAQRVCQVLPARLSSSEEGLSSQELVGACIVSLIQSVAFHDFDQVTKSKTLQHILEIEQVPVQKAVLQTLDGLLRTSADEKDGKVRLFQEKALITLQGKVLNTAIRLFEKSQADSGTTSADSTIILPLLKSWLQQAYVLPGGGLPDGVPEITDEARTFVKDRLASGFEQILKLGKPGIEILRNAISSVNQLEKQGVSMSIQLEDNIKRDVQRGWKKLSKIRLFHRPDSTTVSGKKNPYTMQDGLVLLYCLVLFQIYNGETEAVEILQDVLALEEEWKSSKNGQSAPVSDDVPIVQIILGFASRPSKFMRRVTVQIFEAFAPQLSRHGLESLCEILHAKENVQGQQEMFETRDVEMEDDEIESIGSDVEVLEASTDGSEDESESESEVKSDDDSSDVDSDEEDNADDQDEELAAFDAALASALGTRRLEQGDLGAASSSDSDSDSDMDDDQMMELDSKLIEVFRARQEHQSKNKKREGKDAKENIINFKNRVLDLIDLYLKQQFQNPLAIELMLPLIEVVRTTQAKQVASHASDVLRGLSSRCKGQLAPNLTSSDDVQRSIAVLKGIHEEACLAGSNVHSSLASQGSILVTKSIVKADPTKIQSVVEVYASTRLKQLTDKSCAVLPGFFTDWNNWCQSMEKRLAQ